MATPATQTTPTSTPMPPKPLSNPPRFLIYGEPKTRKTWWALQAAMLGYRVFVLECDKGWDVIHAALPEEYHKNVIILDIADESGDDSRALSLSRVFFGRKPLYISKETGKVTSFKPMKEESFTVNLAKSNLRDFVIYDSMTALSESVLKETARVGGYDLYDDDAMKKKQLSLYKDSSPEASDMSARFRNVQCPMIAIAHTFVKNFFTTDDKGNMVASSKPPKVMPKFTSSTTGMGLGGYFSDVLFFEMQSGGVYIDARSDPNRIGGSRTINKRDHWDKMQLAQILPLYKLTDPTTLPLSEMIS